MSRPLYDFVFLHPPLSFEKIRYPLSGIFESNTGTTDLLTMCPLGMFLLANMLDEAGLRAKVFNIAKVYLKQRDAGVGDALEYARAIRSRIYGVGLHWSAHAAGALTLGRALKESHPDSVVVFGGLSATLYYRELLEEHEFVDYVVLGECEHMFVELVERLLDGRAMNGLPNLAFRGQEGELVYQAPQVPPDVADVNYFAYEHLYEPRPDQYDREAIVQTLPLLRGCYRDCKFCGGSKFSYREHFFRHRLGGIGITSFKRFLRDLMARELNVLRLVGDPRGLGTRYDAQLREAIREVDYSFDVMMELFTLPSRDYLESWCEVSDTLYVVFSPESTFDELRQLHGKHYRNDDILRVAEWCEELGVKVVFCLMYAMPGHDRQKLLEELEFVEEFVRRHPDCGIMYQPYLYVDPGSELETFPERFGTKIRFHSLADIAEALTRPYWVYSIGYELETLTKDDLYESILEITRRKARMYYRYQKLSAVNLLKTIENVFFQARIKAFIDEGDGDDEALSHFITTTLPSYLRRSNTNLIQRPFMGSLLQDRQDLEAFVFEALPLTYEVLLQHGAIDPDAFVARADAFRRDFLAHPELTPQRAAEIAGFLEGECRRRGVTVSFLDELVAFEWRFYLYYDSGTERSESSTLACQHNFDSMAAFLDSTTCHEGRVEAELHPTVYRFEPDAVYSRRAAGEFRLNRFNRKTFRLDKVLRSVIEKQFGLDCGRAYEPV